jgi:hypothetical protein
VSRGLTAINYLIMPHSSHSLRSKTAVGGERASDKANTFLASSPSMCQTDSKVTVFGKASVVFTIRLVLETE